MTYHLPAIVGFLLSVCFSGINNYKPHKNISRENHAQQTKWVDSVFSTLSDDEKIAQLFMIPAYSNKSLNENAGVTELINKYNVGGVIFFQGGPVAQAKMTNYWQNISKTPLLIAIDGEWGLGMRLKDSTVSYPRQMTLGAIQNDNLIYMMGAEIARQMKRIGVHVNFAPVVDVNCNPDNPVINSRSFGELRENVAEKGIAYMKGLQDNGIIATAKHFPGHGDTDKDSHKTLPVINHSAELIDSVDLYPFKELIKNGLDAIMVAHLFVPALDKEYNTATTLSYNVITELLKNKLKFNGLVITDALGMKGVSDYNQPGELEVKAFKAGNDILLMSENVTAAIKAIKNSVLNGEIQQSEIDLRCRKILTYKYKVGLWQKQNININDVYNDLHTPMSSWINKMLYENSTTLIRNTDNLIPIQSIDTLKVACVSVGCNSITDFQKTMLSYMPVDFYNIQANSSYSNILSRLKSYDLVIIGLHSSSNSPSDNFGISQNMKQFVSDVATQNQVVLNIFANPYSLNKFSLNQNVKSVIISYQDNKPSQEAAAMAIFGGIEISGKLPVTASPLFKVNTGISTSKIRLKYTEPEDAGINSTSLNKIDSIALSGIIDTVYPGCQILVAVDGKVIYHKSFGYHTYDNILPVQNSDIYDLASLTKVAATTISIMKLYEQGIINIDDKLSKYLPELDSSNKENIIIRKLMAHRAGLKAWIPFYRSYIADNKLDTTIFSTMKSSKFPYRVAENIFIRNDYPDTLFQCIINSDLRSNTNYKYSDLGFYLLMRMIEKITNETIDKYVKEQFYKPLGLNSICYTPREYFSLSQIVPSEIDSDFRKQIIHGDVNDPGAAMFGGLGGHAGLFSNSNDLAILFQMLIQGGQYGGKRYFKQSTVDEFTKYQYKGDRRGLGFDKPERDRNGGPTCKSASDQSFGHSGFTGTFVWADAKYSIVYVFLSNRTYPSSAVNKLVESGIRSSVQQVIYNAVLNRKPLY